MFKRGDKIHLRANGIVESVGTKDEEVDYIKVSLNIPGHRERVWNLTLNGAGVEQLLSPGWTDDPR